MPVLGRPAPAVDEQPGGVTWLDRLLGDARRGQRLVEVGEAHRVRVRTLWPVTSILTTRARARDHRRRWHVRPCACGRRASRRRSGARAAGDLRCRRRTSRPSASGWPSAGYVAGRTRPVLALRPRLARRPRRGRPAGVASAGRQPRPAQGGRRLPSPHSSASAASPETTGRPGVLGFCLGGTLACGVAAAGDPSLLRQLLRLRRPGHARPPRRRPLPDDLPLRRRRRLHPGGGRRGGRRRARRQPGPRAQRRERRPRLRQPRGADVPSTGGRRVGVGEDDGLPRRAPARSRAEAGAGQSNSTGRAEPASGRSARSPRCS